MKQMQIIRNRKLIGFLTLISIPIGIGLCALTQDGLESFAKFREEQPKTRIEIENYFENSGYREFKTLSKEEVRAIRYHLGGISNPDGLYHDLRNLRSEKNY